MSETNQSHFCTIRTAAPTEGRTRAALLNESRWDVSEIKVGFLEGDPGYYGRRGFERASAHGFEAPSRRIPDPAFQVALLDAHEAWMTGRVLYRDVWWEHDCAGLRDPLLAQLEQSLG